MIRQEVFLLLVVLGNAMYKSLKKDSKMKVGIDISKDTFDVAVQFVSGDSYGMAKYNYTPQGIKSFKRTLSKDAHCVMEATGPYWYRLAMDLVNDGYTVSVVNPLQIKRFAQMRLNRAKTDPADARTMHTDT